MDLGSNTGRDFANAITSNDRHYVQYNIFDAMRALEELFFDSARRCSRPSEHNCWRNCVLKSIWDWKKSSQHDLDTRKRCVRWLSAVRVPNVTTPSIGLQMRWRSLYRQVSLASPKLRFVFTLLCPNFEDFCPRHRYVWHVGRHITRACTRCLCG